MQNLTYNYGFSFAFERSFDYKTAVSFNERYWYLPYISCAIYLILLFGGQRYMRSKPAFELRTILSLWNAGLAIFSIAGCVRFLPNFVYVFRNGGFYGTVCDATFLHAPVPGRWSQFFVISKLVELLDTAFLVLRKRPVIFLHWYHHTTVLLYVYNAYITPMSAAQWFGFMNYSVHSIMYTYYTLRAMGYKLPRALAQAITSLQVSQMFVALYVVFYALAMHHKNVPCEADYTNLWWAVLMYTSYAVLFAQYFMKAYSVKPEAKKID